MADKKKPCDLCGQPVEINGFQLETKKGKKIFCCEGCLGIFRMLNVKDLLAENDN